MDKECRKRGQSYRPGEERSFLDKATVMRVLTWTPRGKHGNVWNQIHRLTEPWPHGGDGDTETREWKGCLPKGTELSRG